MVVLRRRLRQRYAIASPTLPPELAKWIAEAAGRYEQAAERYASELRRID